MPTLHPLISRPTGMSIRQKIRQDNDVRTWRSWPRGAVLGHPNLFFAFMCLLVILPAVNVLVLVNVLVHEQALMNQKMI